MWLVTTILGNARLASIWIYVFNICVFKGDTKRDRAWSGLAIGFQESLACKLLKPCEYMSPPREGQRVTGKHQG